MLGKSKTIFHQKRSPKGPIPRDRLYVKEIIFSTMIPIILPLNSIFTSMSTGVAQAVRVSTLWKYHIFIVRRILSKENSDRKSNFVPLTMLATSQSEGTDVA